MFTEGRKEEMNVESFEYLVSLNLFEVVVVMHIRYGIMKLLIRPIPPSHLLKRLPTKVLSEPSAPMQ